MQRNREHGEPITPTSLLHPDDEDPPATRSSGFMTDGNHTITLKLKRSEYCGSRMKARGFLPTTSWPSCYSHTELRLVLMIYVDDVKLAGAKKHLAQGWERITDAVEMGRQEELGQFLGCNREKIVKTLPNRAVLRGVSYNMEIYLRTLATKYKKLMKDVAGSEPNMCAAPTQFLPEYQKDVPGKNADDDVFGCGLPQL